LCDTCFWDHRVWIDFSLLGFGEGVTVIRGITTDKRRQES
jgi:hypothetical protein